MDAPIRLYDKDSGASLEVLERGRGGREAMEVRWEATEE